MSQVKTKKEYYRKSHDHYPWAGWVVTDVPPSQKPQPQNQSGEGDGEGDQDQKGQPKSGKGRGGSGSGGEDRDNDRQSGQQNPPGYSGESIVTDMGKYVLHRFETFGDFVDTADDRTQKRSGPKWDRHGRQSRKSGNGKSWTSSDTFDEALEEARGGWEGMEKMDAIAQEFTRRTRWTVDTAHDLDVAGTHPDVPEFLSGNPACMVNDGDVRRKVKPFVHIITNNANSWMVGAKSIFNFGAAMMVCIDQIEACGVRVELDASFPVNCYQGKAFTVMVNIKKAHEYAERNRMAYCMANSGFLRRLWFSVVEQHEEIYEGYSGGYGRCDCELPTELIPNGAVYIGRLESDNQNSWETVDKAVAALQKRLGIEISDDGIVTVNKQTEEV